ncbi:MAG: TetR/AcrR family transcriptional regulator [Myxococcales bacterium FL481]|nr:MAG: TetR/AcrR family transcriptional regulator [Myxococcales bacterium FL481]
MMMHGSDEVRKQQIRAAAKRCFVRHGYDGTRLVDIAKEAGLSKGGIYFHYKTKSELFREIMDLHVRAMHQRWSLEPSHEQPPDRLLTMHVTDHLRRLDNEPEQTRLDGLLITLAGQDPAFRQKVDEAHQAMRVYYSKLIDRGIQQGFFARGNPEGIANTILATLTGLGALSVLDGGQRLPVNPDEAATHVCSMVPRREMHAPS